MRDTSHRYEQSQVDVQDSASPGVGGRDRNGTDKTLGFITGTGFYELPNLKDVSPRLVRTPYGDVEITIGTWHDLQVGFLPRHGAQHTIAPSKINYRANLWGLHHIGVTSMFSVCVVGTVETDIKPGDIVLIDQFLDLTKGRRPDTFFDEEGELRHTDMTYPYSGELRSLVAEAGEHEGIDLVSVGTYACFEGPRFESSAEASMARLLGAHVVGMTGYPEVALARELGLELCALAVVSNYAPGVVGNTVSHEEVTAVTDAVSAKLFRLLDRVVQLFAATVEGHAR
jgi:5'-methylthioadenosine phosphorylase